VLKKSVRLFSSNIIIMSKYICARCGYESSQIGHLKKHLNKTKDCVAYYDETSRTKLLEMLNNKKEYLSYLEIIRPLIVKLALKTHSKSTVNDVTKTINESTKSVRNIKKSDKKVLGSDKKATPSDKCLNPLNENNESSKDVTYNSKLCVNCNRLFNSRQARRYHQQNCNSQHIDIINSNNNINSHNTTNNNTTNNTLNVNQPPIVQKPLCIFGQEDISYIVSLDRINDYERIARTDPNNVIPTVVKDIYFNSEHPENHTVRVENIHGNMALVRIGLPDQWKYVDRRETIHSMIKTGINATETGNMDTDNIPRFDTVVNNFYGENNPGYSNTIKSVDTLLNIELKSKLLK
jgi:DNA-directed RNA polymerase subunit RPC12/RpoP